MVLLYITLVLIPIHFILCTYAFFVSFFLLPTLSYYLAYLHAISLTFPLIISSISTATPLSFPACLLNQLIYQMYRLLPLLPLSLYSLLLKLLSSLHACISLPYRLSLRRSWLLILIPHKIPTFSFPRCSALYPSILFHSSFSEISSLAFSVPIRALQSPTIIKFSSFFSFSSISSISPLISLELSLLYYCIVLRLLFLFSFIINWSSILLPQSSHFLFSNLSPVLL